jgi:hypothetical protein
MPPIGPNGRTRTMARMRWGDFDQTDRTMDVQGVERRTFECKQCHDRQAFIVARASEITHVMRH